MKEFYTREKASEGIKFPLHRPDGTKTEHWLLIRGIDSTEYQRANRTAKRQFGLIEVEAKAIEDEEARAKFLDEKYGEQENAILTALVADWSFDEPCVPEKVSEFLHNAPQIAESINQLAARRSFFFGNGKDSSKTSQKRKSNYPSRRKGPKSR